MFICTTNLVAFCLCPHTLYEEIYVLVQGFSTENMKPWKVHWDRQLYKALEHQYQMGLEALNENLPEIRVELTYRYLRHGTH